MEDRLRVDDRERQPRPTASPQTPYLWAGLACLLLAAVVGLTAVARSALSPSFSAAGGMSLALLLVAGGAVLLYAQARNLSWRGAAGHGEPHPLTPEAVRRRKLPPDPARWADRACVLMLLVAAVAFRLPSLSQSFSPEEAAALPSLLGGPPGGSTGGGSPLGSWLASLSAGAFGPLWRGGSVSALPPEWVVRLPAFLLGTLAVWALYRAVREVSDRPSAFAAALLLALSPAAVDASTQAAGYGAVLFLAAAQGWLLARALRTMRAGPWLGWLACLTVGVFAHRSFLLVGGAGLLFLALRAFSSAMREQGWAAVLAGVEQAAVFALAWAAFAAAACRAAGLPLESLWMAGDAAPLAPASVLTGPLLEYWAGAPPGAARTFLTGAAVLFGVGGALALTLRPSGAGAYLLLLLSTPFLAATVAPGRLFGLNDFLFSHAALLTLAGCGIGRAAAGLVGRDGEESPWSLLLAAGGAAACALALVPGLLQVMRLPRCDLRGAANLFDSSNAPVTAHAGAEGVRAYRRVALPTDGARAGGAGGGPSVAFVSGVAARGGGRVTALPGRFPHWPRRALAGCGDLVVTLPVSPARPKR